MSLRFTLFPVAAALILATAGPAAAQNCNPQEEVLAISPVFQQRIQELSANPTAENLAKIAEISEKLTSAGSLIASDPAKACQFYSELRSALNIPR